MCVGGRSIEVSLFRNLILIYKKKEYVMQKRMVLISTLLGVTVGALCLGWVVMAPSQHTHAQMPVTVASVTVVPSVTAVASMTVVRSVIADARVTAQSATLH